MFASLLEEHAFKLRKQKFFHIFIIHTKQTLLLQIGNRSEYYNIKNILPEFTEADIEYNRGTSDFFGLNHYTSNLVYSCGPAYDEVPNRSQYSVSLLIKFVLVLYVYASNFVYN